MKLNCIMCPLGCEMEIEELAGGEIRVSGNTCLRGVNYANQERKAPMRAVSSLVRAGDGVVPVKTSGLVPKSKIDEILSELAQIRLSRYPEFNSVIIKNILGLGVDIISIGY